MDYTHFLVEPGQQFTNSDGSFVITVDRVDRISREIRYTIMELGSGHYKTHHQTERVFLDGMSISDFVPARTHIDYVDPALLGVI